MPHKHVRVVFWEYLQESAEKYREMAEAAAHDESPVFAAVLETDAQEVAAALAGIGLGFVPAQCLTPMLTVLDSALTLTVDHFR